MRKILDFHIHSKYARATSKYFELAEMVKWAEIKGVDIISCADFTHPRWLENLQKNLQEEPAGSGLYQLIGSPSAVRFIIATELSCIYRQNDKTRRVHLCILMPSLESAARFNQALIERGAKLASDGRPILGMSAKDVLAIMLEIDNRAMMIPAHVWTPWFAVFGSKSGFVSLEECFEDLTGHIRAIETGLSSDPTMNWRLKALDNITLVSNSDAHSGPQIGREANVMDLKEFSFAEISNIITTGDQKRFLYTIEVFPEEGGMYHWDGHRSCNFSCAPEERIKQHKDICPVCRKPMTIGALSQIEKMADRAEKDIDIARRIPFKNIIPLPRVIADYYGMGVTSKAVTKLFEDIISQGQNEFRVLLDLDEVDLKKIMPALLAEGIMRMRRKEVRLIPGFDGQYGSVEIFSDKEKTKIKENRQAKLF